MLVFGRLGDLVGYRRDLPARAAGERARLRGMRGGHPPTAWCCSAACCKASASALTLSCGPALATSLFNERERTRVLGFYAGVFAVRLGARTLARRSCW